MIYIIALLVLVLLLNFPFSRADNGCKYPLPAANFHNIDYTGKWYEIGKIQTKGGAFFEKNCVCTQLDVSIVNNETGDARVLNECRWKTPDGYWVNVTGDLSNEQPTLPGKWLEKIGSSAPVNYTVIAIDNPNYSVEYVCIPLLIFLPI